MWTLLSVCGENPHPLKGAKDAAPPLWCLVGCERYGREVAGGGEIHSEPALGGEVLGEGQLDTGRSAVCFLSMGLFRT
jgi:hypothetical protein